MENEVTNYDLSKKLSDLGFPQNSFFKWVEKVKVPPLDIRADEGDVTKDPSREKVWVIDHVAMPETARWYSAFSAQELAVTFFGWTVSRAGNSERDWYEAKIASESYRFVAETLADVFALMIIYLIESDLWLK